MIETAQTNAEPVSRPPLPKGAVKGKAARKQRASTSPRGLKKLAKEPRSAPKGKARAHDRTGKPIIRAKPGQPGRLAAKGLHLLVVRVPKAVHKAAWRKAKKMDLSVAAWLNGVIARAAK